MVVVAGTVVVDVGPNESAQFSPGAHDLKLKLKKIPIICPGAGADSMKTLTMRCFPVNAVNSGSVIVRDDPEKA